MNEPKKKRKAQPKPVYFVVRKLVDPVSGEEVGCLVPRFRVDQRLMRDRGYTVGTEIRAELKKPRNSKFHRLVHQLGCLIVDQIEKYRGKDAHEAIKDLQLESGLECDQEEFDLPGLGKFTRKVPRSLAFDQMEEGAFYALFRGICTHVCQIYWPGMTAAEVERQAELMREQV